MSLMNVKEFMNVVNGCVGSVWLENVDGQKVDLKKATEEQVVNAMKADSDFELYAAAREDVNALLGFMKQNKAA